MKRIGVLSFLCLALLLGFNTHFVVQANPHYNDVFFYSSTQGWIVGDSGTILRTVDGGNTFTRQNPTTLKLNSVFFTSPTRGYAVGATTNNLETILRSLDGGTNWSSVSPDSGLPTGNELFTVFARGDSLVWAAGANGRLWKSINGGDSWSSLPSGVTGNIRSIFFTSDLDGVLVGKSGTNALIRYTVDGGSTWTTAYTSGGNELYSVKFVDANVGLAVGDTIANGSLVVRTTDGGINWTTITAPGDILKGISWVNSNSVWVVGDSGTIIKSDDGGLTWSSQISPTAQQLNGVAAPASSLTVAVGNNGTVIKTAAAGDWDTQIAPLPKASINFLSISSSSRALIAAKRGYAFRSITSTHRRFASVATGLTDNLNGAASSIFSSSILGYVVGDNGKCIVISAAGTATQLSLPSVTTQNLRGVAIDRVFGGPHTIVVGDSGIVRRTTNDGASWDLPTIPAITENLYGVIREHTDVGVIVGDGGRIMTSGSVNAATNTWSNVPDPISNRSTYNYRALASAYKFSGVICAVGLVGPNNTSSVISYSDNSGATFTHVTAPFVNIRLRAIWKQNPLSTDIMYVAGDNGVIFRSSDGVTWTSVASPTTLNITSVSGYSDGNDNYVFFGCDDGTIFKTRIDSSTYVESTWSTIMPATLGQGDITDMHFIDSNNGWVVAGEMYRTTNASSTMTWTSTGVTGVGDSTFQDTVNGFAWINSGTDIGRVKRTTDGSTWNNVSAAVGSFAWKKIHYVSGLNPSQRVLMVGGANTVLRTTNSGSAWNFQNTRNDIQGLWVNSTGTSALACGANGMIMRTTNSGTTWYPLNSPPNGSSTHNFVKIVGSDSFASEALVITSTGEVYRNINIGSTTQAWTLEIDIGNAAYDIAWEIGTSNVLVVGSNTTPRGVIYRSTDRGDNWTLEYTHATDPSIDSVSWYSTSGLDVVNAVAVNAAGGFFRSTDDGNTWSQPSDTGAIFYGVSAIWDGLDDRVVAIGDLSGAGVAWSSTDFGLTWATIAAPPAIFRSVHMLSRTDCIACGASGATGNIRRWNSGTNTWSASNLTATTDTLYKKIHITGGVSGDGWAVGDRGAVIRSLDGGLTWTAVQIARTGSGVDVINSIHSSTTSVCAVGGTSTAKVFNSADSGDTWSEVNEGGALLNDVFMFDGTTRFAVGDDGRIIKTTNSGVTWAVKKSSSGRVLNAVHFKDANVGVAVGDNYTTVNTSPVVFTTTDGGDSWTPRNVGSYMDLKSCAVRPSSDEVLVGGFRGTLVSISNVNLVSPNYRWRASGQFLKHYFPNTETGFLCGFFGTLLKSTDRGSTWYGLQSPTGYHSNSVFFIDKNQGWFCGGESSFGEIYNTTDSGITWSQQTTATSQFNDITFWDAKTGIAVGGTPAVSMAKRTTDGGATWNLVSFVSGSYMCNRVYFASKDVLWICAGFDTLFDGQLFKSTDGGANFSPSSTGINLAGAGGENVRLYGIDFFDPANLSSPQIGLVCGKDRIGPDAKVYRTTNGGANWSQVLTVVGNGFRDVKYLDANTVLVVGTSTSTSNLTYRSTSGGTSGSWASFTNPAISSSGAVDFNPNRIQILGRGLAILSLSNTGIGIHSLNTHATQDALNPTWEFISGGSTQSQVVSFTDASNGFIATTDGRAFKTANSGKTFSTELAGGNINSIWSRDANTAWVVGNGGSIARLNAGTWSGVTNNLSEDLTDVNFVDANIGFVVGERGLVLKTVDGGQTWTVQSSGTQNRLNAVSFVDSSNGLAVGEKGTIIRTTNGGTTWLNDTSGTNLDLLDVHYVTLGTRGIVVGKTGTTGTILIGSSLTGTTSTWVAVASLPAEDYVSVRFFSDTNGIALGRNGRYLTTTNGGTSWTTTNFLGNSDLTHIAIAGTNAFISGPDNLVLRSTDSGSNWHVISIGTINSIQYIDSNNGYACSSNGRVIKTTDGGVTWRLLTSGANVKLNGLSFIDANNGYIVGDSSVIRKTVDGGTTWTSEGGATTNVTSVHFFDATHAGASGAGGQGYMLDTSPPWANQLTGVTEDMTVMKMNTTLNAWAAGKSGRIAIVRSGVADTLFTEGTADYNGIWNVSATLATVVGTGGTIRRTTDGTSFSPIASGTTKDLFWAFSVDANTGYATGADGLFLKSGNQGAAWTVNQSTTRMNLKTGSNVGTNTLFFAGEEGIILKHLTAAWTSINPVADGNAPSASIVIKATDPLNSTLFTRLLTVNLELTASDDTGIDKVQYSNDGATYSPLENFSATKTGWNLSLFGGSPTDGPKTVYYRVVDFAGNPTVKTASIMLDQTPPVATIKINSDASYATSSSVTLTLSAGDTSGIKQVEYSGNNSVWTAPLGFVSSRTWNLNTDTGHTVGDGLKTVYYRVTDNANNVSSPIPLDSIILDTAFPSAAPVPIAPQTGAQIFENTNVSLSWTDVRETSNDIFDIEWAENSGFTLNLRQDTTTQLFYGIPASLLVAGKTYFWRVRFRDQAGNPGPWSTVSDFTIISVSFGVLTMDKVLLSDLVVTNSDQNVLAHIITATANNVQDITITELKLKEAGTPNNKGTDISSVILYYDVNSNGQVDTGIDQQLGSLQAYATDYVTFNFSLTVPKNQTRQMLVIYNFSGNANIGNKFQVQIEQSSHVIATGASQIAGTFAVTGRNIQIVGGGSTGQLDFSKGVNSPPGNAVVANQVFVDMLQLKLTASVENIAINELEVNAKGTSFDNIVVKALRIILDDPTNPNGRYDPVTDRVLVELKSPTVIFSSNDGTLRLVLPGGSQEVVIAKNSSQFLIVQYDLGDQGFILQDTILSSVKPTATTVKAMGKSSGNQVTITVTGAGGELDGNTMTFKNPGTEAKGSFTVTKINYTLSSNKILPYEHNIIMMKMNVRASGFEDIRVNLIALRSMGTGNDPKDIVSVLLVDDINKDGEFNPDIDSLIKQVDQPFTGDDAVVFIGDLAVNISKGTDKNILVLFNFSGFGEDGRTFKAISDVKTQITAIGLASNQTIAAEGVVIEGQEIIMAPLVGSSGKSSPKGCISADSVKVSNNNPFGPIAILAILITLVVSLLRRPISCKH